MRNRLRRLLRRNTRPTDRGQELLRALDAEIARLEVVQELLRRDRGRV